MVTTASPKASTSKRLCLRARSCCSKKFMCSYYVMLTRNFPQVSQIHTEVEKQFQCQRFIKSPLIQSDTTGKNEFCANPCNLRIAARTFSTEIHLDRLALD